MRLARGPRPLAIRLFAIAFVAQGGVAFWHQISNLRAMQAIFVEALPGVPIGRDLTIVLVCARLTIALIPVALVWLLASRVARWLVLLFTVAKLAAVPGDLSAMAPGESVSGFWLAPLVLAVAGAALLFTRPATRWFASRGRRVADTLP